MVDDDEVSDVVLVGELNPSFIHQCDGGNLALYEYSRIHIMIMNNCLNARI